MKAIEEVIAKMQEIEDDPETQDGWDAWITLNEWIYEQNNQNK